MASLDQLRHLTVEKSHQQGPDVRTIHVRVCHDDDLMITQFVQVEVCLLNAGSQSRNDDSDLFAFENFIESGLLHIEDLSLQG